MQITIDLDDELLRDAVFQIVRDQFVQQRFGDTEGMKLLKQQVIAYVRTIDFSTLIREVANAHIRGLVDQVVSTTLKMQYAPKPARCREKGRCSMNKYIQRVTIVENLNTLESEV